MSGVVSARTAEVALVALKIALRVVEPRRNGRPAVVRDIALALAELEAASSAVGTTLDSPARVVEPFEEITVAEVANRLGISERAVTKRISAGTLSARKVGTTWLVRWTGEERRGDN